MTEHTTQNDFKYRNVEEHVLSLIENGSLTTGDKLPSLRKMCSSMNVSLSTASQAYMELERKGVVESKPRSGYFVKRAARRLPPTSVPVGTTEPRDVTRSGLINTVLNCIGRKEMVPLGILAPDPKLLPARELAKIMNSVIREDPEYAISYELIAGLPALRRQIALHVANAGVSVSPEEPIITHGCMEALYIAFRSITRPGDTVLIQSPTYFCFLQLLETLGLKVVEVPSHPDLGLQPHLIENVLRKFDITACAFSPNFNNPDGSLTPDSAKREILAMLSERNIPIVEDDVYGDLHFGEQRPTTLRTYDTRGLVIQCGSFSKTLASGYRVGWILPGKFRAKALEIKATTNVCSATPPQLAIAEYLKQGRYPRQLRKMRDANKKQMDIIHLQLERYFPAGTRVSHPAGGGVLWVELPEGTDGVELFYQARTLGISVAPGAIFSTLDKFNNFIRLSCSGLWTEQLRDGVERLGNLAKNLAP